MYPSGRTSTAGPRSARSACSTPGASTGAAPYSRMKTKPPAALQVRQPSLDEGYRGGTGADQVRAGCNATSCPRNCRRRSPAPRVSEAGWGPAGYAARSRAADAASRRGRSSRTATAPACRSDGVRPGRCPASRRRRRRAPRRASRPGSRRPGCRCSCPGRPSGSERARRRRPGTPARADTARLAFRRNGIATSSRSRSRRSRSRMARPRTSMISASSTGALSGS